VIIIAIRPIRVSFSNKTDMNKFFIFFVIANLAILFSCSKETEEDTPSILGGSDPIGIYYFCGNNAVTEAHNSTLTVSAEEEILTLDILSYGLKSITKTGGSEFIVSEVEKFSLPPDPKYYYNTVGNPYYKFFRYRQSVTFLFTDKENSVEPLTATFRIESIGHNGHYADVTIIKDKNNKL